MKTKNLIREPEGSWAHGAKQLTRDEVEEALQDHLKYLKTNCFTHQLIALATGLTHNSWLFALDMGLGKTKIALDIFAIP